MSRLNSTLPPIAPNLTTDWMQTQTFVASVWVPLLQNVGGGFGVFVFALVGLWQVFGLDLAPAVKVAAIIAGLTFGVFMVIRAFRDEVAFLVAQWASYHDRATLAQRDALIADLQAQIVRLREGEAPATAFELQADTGMLIVRHFEQHLPTDRRKVMAAKLMTRPRWERATNLLRDAQCLDGQKQRWLAPNEARAWGRVVMHLKRSGKWIKAQDGEWSKQ
jgi:hypothetical protein